MPCEKLSLATSMPALMSLQISVVELLEGPSVQTIFVFLFRIEFLFYVCIIAYFLGFVL